MKTILGIDPGTRHMGVVVLRGQTILDSGVHNLKNGSRPHDVIGQARRIIFAYIARTSPEIVAIEQPIPRATARIAVLSVIVQELNLRARELGLSVVELSPQVVRHQVCDNPHATKIDVAEALVANGFPDLAGKIPRRPARPALGLRPKDKYWLHMFDALGVAVAVQDQKNRLR